MTEAWAGVAEQQAAAEQSVAVQRLADGVVDLITGPKVLAVLLLAVAGIVVGIATVQGVKLGLRVWKGEPRSAKQRNRRALLYRFAGMVLGLVYATALEIVVMRAFMGLGWLVSMTVGSAAGIVSGGLTPKSYDLWHNSLLPWISRKLAGKGRKRRKDGEP